jgi:XTP/dITP diphosphohydrolase
VEEFLEHATGKKFEGAITLDQSAMQEEFGDLLFSLVNLSRFLNIRAEEAMEQACHKFVLRFTAIEQLAEARGKHLKDMTLVEMDALWEEIKRGANSE